MIRRRFDPQSPEPDRQSLPGLYVHIPFCARVCPYCDFAVRRDDPELRERFVDALIAEAGGWDCEVPFDTVYLGGGTPSLLDVAQLERLCGALREALPIESDAVLSLEANPEDVTPERLAAWCELDFEVLSLGVQSLDDGTLQALGRRHRRTGALEALIIAAASPLRVSVDLIYGHPSQELESWLESLEQVLDFGVEHLSCYELTVHSGTPFQKLASDGRLRLASQDERAVWFTTTHRVLEGLGWSCYEVSNFARRPEWRSRHNQKYWCHEPYLGLGPSAHSFDGRRRWWNVRGTESYVERLGGALDAVEETERLGDEDLLLEALMLRLRTSRGLPLEWLAARHGSERVDRVLARAKRYVAQGLLRLEHHGDGRRAFLRPSTRGLAVADSLAPDLAR